MFVNRTRNDIYVGSDFLIKAMHNELLSIPKSDPVIKISCMHFKDSVDINLMT